MGSYARARDVLTFADICTHYKLKKHTRRWLIRSHCHIYPRIPWQRRVCFDYNTILQINGSFKGRNGESNMATTTVTFKNLTPKMLRFHDLALNMFHKYNHVVTQATFYDATHFKTLLLIYFFQNSTFCFKKTCRAVKCCLHLFTASTN